MAYHDSDASSIASSIAFSDVVASSPSAEPQFEREASLESSLSSLSDLSYIDDECDEKARRANRADAAETFVRHVLDIYAMLDAMEDLKPCEQVNHLFNDLVTSCLEPENEALSDLILKDARILAIVPKLREFCAIGETQLELFWSTQIQSNLFIDPKFSDFDEAFEDFPYYDNYERITEIEASLIRSAFSNSDTIKSPTMITFIGSGPLPLTSLLLSKKHFPEAQINNVDHDSQALAASKALRKLLCVSRRIEEVEADASSVPSATLSCSEVTYLAALVGMSAEEKTKILSNIAAEMWEDGILVARSAHGLRSLLYPVLDVEALDLPALGLQLVEEWIPQDDEVVNSVLIFRKIRAWHGDVVEL